MTWDPEKYREKREKVLGKRQRGISFGVLAAIVSCVLIVGTASLSLPGAVSYMRTRHLDDAIFKLEGNQVWPSGLVASLAGMDGVAGTSLDTHNTRLVITFDRRRTGPDAFLNLFKQQDLSSSMLNRVGHRQRMTTLAGEKEAKGETL